ncbi:MAG: hypothetical protein K0S53_560 [Bacteroidetes bacterium]|jgi:hypothetical protein|nr:hypothetical protein [Bacteroidota bacterium]
MLNNKQTLKLEEEFDVDIHVLYDQFCDFQKYGMHHPVMKTVKIVDDKRPEYIEYEIDEEVLLFGLIKIRPNYKAKVIEIEKNKKLRYTSQVKSYVFLIIDFHFTESDGKTKMIEHIEVTTNRFVAFVFLDILKKAHLKVYQNIKSHFRVQVN